RKLAATFKVPRSRSTRRKCTFLVYTSGATWGAPYEDFPEVNGWDRIMALNVKSLFYRWFLPPSHVQPVLTVLCLVTASVRGKGIDGRRKAKQGSELNGSSYPPFNDEDHKWDEATENAYSMCRKVQVYSYDQCARPKNSTNGRGNDLNHDSDKLSTGTHAAHGFGYQFSSEEREHSANYNHLEVDDISINGRGRKKRKIQTNTFGIRSLDNYKGSPSGMRRRRTTARDIICQLFDRGEKLVVAALAAQLEFGTRSLLQMYEAGAVDNVSYVDRWSVEAHKRFMNIMYPHALFLSETCTPQGDSGVRPEGNSSPASSTP
ncbi:hypothetical protein BKA62DRAFT_673266, partial [Auriculariales sp. MPI-PUGE-AT-0066]